MRELRAAIEAGPLPRRGTARANALLEERKKRSAVL